MRLRIVGLSLGLATAGCAPESDNIGVQTSQFSEEHLLFGHVTDADGNPASGVMVRIKDSDSLIAESVFTDADGFYQLPTNLDGELALRTRVPYYRDQTIDVSFNADEAVKLNINLEAMESDEEISNSLPSVFHFNQIEFDQDPDSVLSRSGFQRDCAGCHQFGNEFTRMDREGGLWSATIRRMHGYMGNADADLIARRAAMLDLDGPYGEPVRARPQFPVIPEMTMAKIYEYPLKDVIFPHDAEISEVDGLSYSVDRLGDAMVITDMQTGKSVYVKMPDPLRPAVENANGYTSRSFKPGPHSLAMGTDELWYTTNATSDEIGVFDPKTQSWVKSYIVPEPARYPHTVRIGADGIVWFTLAGSEQVGRLDPQTGDVQLIDLPQRKPVGIAGATTPYGIDISSVDGKVWYARLYGDAIGYVDPETLKVTEYDSPVRGPRRLRFDKSGQLWVTGYTDGVIAQIKPDAMDIKVHKMPEFEKDHRPAPYSLAIHPVTQEVWINETMNDRVYRYIPAEDRFLSYPMPLRGTYTRDFSFTKDGKACTANSPIMNFALEDGMANLICIDPDKFELQS
ncbi:MAG: carboxypeptidase regulatory-like domain-containing protein [Pseudomonadota bacterium]